MCSAACDLSAREFLRAFDRELLRDDSGRRISARLTTTNRDAVLPCPDSARAPFVHLRQPARINGERHVLRFAGTGVNTLETSQGQPGRHRAVWRREINLHHLIAGYTARIRHIRLNLQRIAGVNLVRGQLKCA